jgi:hypothetical protein
MLNLSEPGVKAIADLPLILARFHPPDGCYRSWRTTHRAWSFLAPEPPKRLLSAIARQRVCYARRRLEHRFESAVTGSANASPMTSSETSSQPAAFLSVLPCLAVYNSRTNVLGQRSRTSVMTRCFGILAMICPITKHRSAGACTRHVDDFIHDAYNRILAPSP